MYTVTSAARISSGSLPARPGRRPPCPGKPSAPERHVHFLLDFFDGLGGAPSEALGARLKEMVTHGNWPWWLMESGALSFEMRERAQGTAPPFTGRARGIRRSGRVVAEGPGAARPWAKPPSSGCLKDWFGPCRSHPRADIDIVQGGMAGTPCLKNYVVLVQLRVERRDPAAGRRHRRASRRSSAAKCPCARP
jgi:hypothetical protein